MWISSRYSHMSTFLYQLLLVLFHSLFAMLNLRTQTFRHNIWIYSVTTSIYFFVSFSFNLKFELKKNSLNENEFFTSRRSCCQGGEEKVLHFDWEFEKNRIVINYNVPNIRKFQKGFEPKIWHLHLILVKCK